MAAQKVTTGAFETAGISAELGRLRNGGFGRHWRRKLNWIISGDWRARVAFFGKD